MNDEPSSQFHYWEHDHMRAITRFNLSPRMIASLAGIAILGFAFAPAASAQRRTNWQYQPSSPTLSPYMNLLQTNFGPVPNYFSLVRPQLQQQAFNQQVQANERSTSLQIQAIEEQAVLGSPVPRTGKSGGFMEYLHYYPPPRLGTRRQ
jgi:hypothetical protein